MSKSILMLGGAFDPVHNGHLIIARAVAEKLGFDRVLLVPAAQSPHKGPSAASTRQRLEMVQLAVAGEGLFDVCDLELGRTGPSYTIDTVTQFRTLHGQDLQLHLLVGADVLEDLPKWHRVGELLKMIRLVVAVRYPWSLRLPQTMLNIEEHLGAKPTQEIMQHAVETPVIEISSTQIRQRVSRGQSIAFLVPPAVQAYITSHSLYR